MGGEGSKQNQAQAQVQSLIDNAFNNASRNKTLTKQQFNQSMKVFQAFNTLNICNTHMASRLYQVLQQSKGKLDKDQVIQKFKKFVTQPDKCLRYSFRIYDADNDRKIGRRDFSDFFEKSWLTQVEIVLDKIKNIPECNIHELTEWARARRQEILQVATHIFNDLDSQKKNYLELKDFEKWVNSKQFDLMVFKYKDAIIKFPLHIDAMINVV